MRDDPCARAAAVTAAQSGRLPNVPGDFGKFSSVADVCELSSLQSTSKCTSAPPALPAAGLFLSSASRRLKWGSGTIDRLSCRGQSAIIYAIIPGVRDTGAVVAFGAALIAAYAAHELVLFAATPFLGGEGDFTVAIVGRLGGLNVVWPIGLIGLRGGTAFQCGAAPNGVLIFKAPLKP